MNSPLLETVGRVMSSVASAACRNNRLIVLTYHRVPEASDPMYPTEPEGDRFAEQLRFMRSAFNLLDLTEAVARLRSGALPARAACITFDDGYANNLDVAAPILRAHGVPATVFVSTRFLEGRRMWNDTVIEAIRRAGPEIDFSRLGLGQYQLNDWSARRAAVSDILGKLKYRPLDERESVAEDIAGLVAQPLPASPMLSEQGVRALVSMGIKIGAHTVSHPILARLDGDRAVAEIVDSKHVLEGIIREEVAAFAYPNGRPGRDYSAEHVNMVRDAGFSVAVSTAWGAARRDTDPLQVPRVAPWHGSFSRDAARLLRTYLDPVAPRA